MARTKANLSTFAFTQSIETVDYWSYKEDQEAIRNDNIKKLGDNIIKRFNQLSSDSVAELYLIVHDRDLQKKWDDSINNYVLDSKQMHLHGVCKLNKGKELAIEQISATLGLEQQYVERPKSGRYSYNNMLSYLIHIKDINKAQYEPKSVITAKGTDYQEIYNTNREQWIKGRAKNTAIQAKLGVDELEEMILSGELTKEQVLLTDEYFTIYSRNSVRLDKIFEVYAERKAYKTIQAMAEGDFLLSVFFITGQSRSGKSYFSDELAKKIKEEMSSEKEKWQLTRAAATNSLDDYMGEEVLLLDDLRGVAMTSSDWLKLLDPERINPISARYKNKKVASRVVIINSTKTPLEFFYYVKNLGGGDRSEAMDQFFARILKLVRVIRVNEERKYIISKSKKVDKYKLTAPDNGDLEMNYAFVDDQIYQNIDSALENLVDDVKNRNNLNDGLPF